MFIPDILVAKGFIPNTTFQIFDDTPREHNLLNLKKAAGLMTAPYTR